MFQATGNLNLPIEEPAETQTDPNLGSQPSLVRGSGSASRKGKRKAPPSSNATVTDGGYGGPNKKPLRLISKIWDHYKVEIIDEARIATCLYCDTRVPADKVKNTTSSVRNHYLHCTMSPSKVQLDQTCINFPPVGSIDVPSSHKWQYNPKELMDAIVDKFIVDETCFTEVDKPGFRKMCKIGFHPCFTLPSRRTLASKCMDRHEDFRNSLKLFFSKKSQRVSLTSDCWTSNQNKNYMSVTAHYVDGNFKLQKKNSLFCCY